MYALGLLGDAVYIIGGQMKVHHHYIITDSVVRWSLKRGGSWLSFAPLPLPLACHCVVSLKERLYVLGGWTPQVPGKKTHLFCVQYVKALHQNALKCETIFALVLKKEKQKLLALGCPLVGNCITYQK